MPNVCVCARACGGGVKDRKEEEQDRKGKEIAERKGTLLLFPFYSTQTYIYKQAHLHVCHTQEQALAAVRLQQKSAQLWPSETGSIISRGDLNFWKATNSPQSHNAKELPTWGRGSGGRRAGEGKKGFLTN